MSHPFTRSAMDVLGRLYIGLAFALTLVGGAQVTFQLTGRTLVLGGVSYFVPPSPVSQLQLIGDIKTQKLIQSIGRTFAGALIPFSALTTETAHLDENSLEKTLHTWETLDDVWSRYFLTGLFVSFNGTSRSPPSISLPNVAKSLGTQIVLTSKQYTSGTRVSEKLAPGPYFVDAISGNVFQALRLYNDENQAFLYGTISDGHDGFQELSAHIGGAATESIAVPSRLYFTPTAQKPLADTGGSMRGPSGANGVFGNRPSHGAVPLDDVMPLSPELDTGGIFARDAKSWATAGHWWYQNFTSFTSFPKTILFPIDDFGQSFLSNPPRPGTANALFNDFINKMETFLGTNRTEINFSNMWNTTKPANVTAPSLQLLLNTTYADIITLDQIALVADPFIADYKVAHDGRTPFINPTPLARWGYGRTLPATQKNEALVNKSIFMDWFATQVVKSDNATCSESIFLYPQSSGRTNYRDQYRSPPGVPFGFSSGRIAVYAETPDMVVPIGELAYNSTVSGVTEFLPVSLSFIAAKGCDLMLFDFFAALQDAGIISPVQTGSRLFQT
ncbi:unnamed protein product [Somion occarium]|uniref:Uncharacterized protein n=1 Tax=Somion occarium TaxID=3059160 RepID=A0ABP1DU63_9APHY